MKIHSILASRSSFAAALLFAGAFSACAAEGPEGWQEDTGVEPGEVLEDTELGSVELPFSNSATTSAVSANENLAAPFISAVKFNLGASCSGVKIPNLSGSNRVRILTAAHCIAESASNRTVAITNNTAGNSPTNFTIPANRTFVHPSFQLGNVGGGLVSQNVYDLAFFELDAGPTFATTPLDFGFVADNGVSLMGIGYGNAGVACGSVGGTKLKAGVLSVFVAGSDRDAHFIHASGEPRNCPGDSGGPVLRGTGANAKVAGIVSAISVQGNPPLSAYARVQGAIEWLNDPVDSTLATIPASLISNGSNLYFMNGALASSRPLLGCAVMNGKGSVSGTDVRIHTCDVLDGTTDGNSPAWVLLTSPAGGGSFKILNRRNGLCMGVNTTPVGLTNVAAFTCATSGAALDRQSWTFEKVAGVVAGTSAYRLRTRAASGFCLNAGAGTENADVVLSTCGANVLDAHKWYLTR